MIQKGLIHRKTNKPTNPPTSQIVLSILTSSSIPSYCNSLKLLVNDSQTQCCPPQKKVKAIKDKLPVKFELKSFLTKRTLDDTPARLPNEL